MAVPLIQLTGIGKTYRLGNAEVRALREVSLTIERAEMVAIMGPSGSGKSTLMNVIGLLDSPSQGRYMLDGAEVGHLSAERRAVMRGKDIGFVFQNFNLLNRNTAFENVELPLLYAGVEKTERTRRTQAALDAVELSSRARHWPHQLSGGEQQRVAIARAVVNGPSIVLADEPTGSLDTKTGLEILALFQLLNGAGRTIVLVTHDPEIARYAHRIVSLRDGAIVADTPVSNRLDAAAEIAGRSAA